MALYKVTYHAGWPTAIRYVEAEDLQRAAALAYTPGWRMQSINFVIARPIEPFRMGPISGSLAAGSVLISLFATFWVFVIRGGLGAGGPTWPAIIAMTAFGLAGAALGVRIAIPMRRARRAAKPEARGTWWPHAGGFWQLVRDEARAPLAWILAVVACTLSIVLVDRAVSAPPDQIRFLVQTAGLLFMLVFMLISGVDGARTRLEDRDEKEPAAESTRPGLLPG